MPRVHPSKNWLLGKDLHLGGNGELPSNIFSGRLEELSPSPEIVSAIGDFSGAAQNDILAFLKIVPYFTLFHGMYLRAIVQESSNSAISAYNRTTEKEDEKSTIHSDMGAAGKQKLNLVDGEDTYGKIPKWENPSFKDMIEEFKKFVALIEIQMGGNTRDARQYLQSVNIGLFQCWAFWRYFSKKSLDLKFTISDIKEAFNGRLAESEIFSSPVMLNFTQEQIDKLSSLASSANSNLSSPRRNLACNNSLGCVQNLSVNDAPKANLLSFEHEHSRPLYYGGKDKIDSSAMCWLHNKLKHENPLFDVDTFLNILLF